MPGRSVEELLAELEPLGVRLDLATFRALLDELGSPQRHVRSILVGGTNGKGSVAALVASVAQAAGIRTGLYTSPHLERWEERIRLDGACIGSRDLAQRIGRIVEAAHSSSLPAPTVFEVMTAAALAFFADNEVELAVLEVGLGGRLDATNAVDPLLAIVTRIALDHREWLGSDLASIAREKSGIFRAGMPALISRQEPEAEAALVEMSTRIGARLHRVSDEVEVVSSTWLGLLGHHVVLRTRHGSQALDLPLAGAHQLENLATAVAAADLLANTLPEIDAMSVRAGVASVRWPARLEAFPVARPPCTVLLDAAHNPDGCLALRRFLERLGRSYVLLFGALSDKQVEEMLPPLASAARSVVLTRPDSSRALEPASLVPLLEERSRDTPPSVASDPVAALDLALAAAEERGAELVVACGSIYLAGSLRRELRRRQDAGPIDR